MNKGPLDVSLGIVIRMYFADHAPPHFHAVYGGDEAVVVIATGEILRGALPDRALRRCDNGRRSIATNWLPWERTQVPEQPTPIEPLP